MKSRPKVTHPCEDIGLPESIHGARSRVADACWGWSWSSRGTEMSRALLALHFCVRPSVTFGIYADFERAGAPLTDCWQVPRIRGARGVLGIRAAQRGYRTARRHRPVQQRQWERNVVWRRTIGRVLRGLERQSRLTLALLSRVNPNFRFWPLRSFSSAVARIPRKRLSLRQSPTRWMPMTQWLG